MSRTSLLVLSAFAIAMALVSALLAGRILIGSSDTAVAQHDQPPSSAATDYIGLLGIDVDPFGTDAAAVGGTALDGICNQTGDVNAPVIVPRAGATCAAGPPALGSTEAGAPDPDTESSVLGSTQTCTTLADSTTKVMDVVLKGFTTDDAHSIVGYQFGLDVPPASDVKFDAGGGSPNTGTAAGVFPSTMLTSDPQSGPYAQINTTTDLAPAWDFGVGDLAPFSVVSASAEPLAFLENADGTEQMDAFLLTFAVRDTVAGGVAAVVPITITANTLPFPRIFGPAATADPANSANDWIPLGPGGVNDISNVQGAQVAINGATCPLPPVAADGVAATTEDTPTSPITLSATDADNCELTFSIASNPSNGSLGSITNNACVSGTPNSDSASVIYTPNANFCGNDSFTFLVDDGSGGLDLGTITITVTCVNDVPSCSSPTDTTAEDTAFTYTTALCTDPDVGDTVTCALVGVETGGVASGISDCTPTFTPTANLCGAGAGSFQYNASDGTATSNTGTATLNITCVNDAPVCPDASPATVDEDSTDNPITLPGCTDPVEGNAVTCALDTDAANGSATVTDCTAATYTPNPNFCGADSFIYKGTDNGTPSPASDTGTASITVTCLADPPICGASAQSVVQNKPVTFALPCSDPDPGASVTCSIVTPASKGSVNLAGCAATYTPNAGATGQDSFTYKSNDGTADSNIATATLNLVAGAQTPTPTPTPSALPPTGGEGPFSGGSTWELFLGLALAAGGAFAVRRYRQQRAGES